MAANKVREKVTSSGVRVKQPRSQGPLSTSRKFAHDVMGAIGAPLWGPLSTGVRWRQHRADVSGFVSSPSGWGYRGWGGWCWLSIDGRVGLSSTIPRGFWRVSIPQGLRGIQGPGHDRPARASALETTQLTCFFYFLVNLFFKKMDKPVGFGIGSDRCAVHGVFAIRCDRYDNFIYTRYFQQLS